jgi:dynein heavy chain 1
MRNLHVVFTMNPSANGLRDRASTSPALFNRCVLDWLGDWSLDAYYHVASELTHGVDMQKADVIFLYFLIKKRILIYFSILLRKHYLV